MKANPPPSLAIPSDTVLIINKEPVKLTWTKRAMYYAEEVGIYTGSMGSGFGKAVKYVWAMGPDSLRGKFPTPADLAEHVPAMSVVWPKIKLAIDQAGEGMEPKNVFGSVNGPLPSSNSTSPANSTTGS